MSTEYRFEEWDSVQTTDSQPEVDEPDFTHECEWCQHREFAPDSIGKRFHCPKCAQSAVNGGWLMLPVEP